MKKKIRVRFSPIAKLENLKSNCDKQLIKVLVQKYYEEFGYSIEITENRIGNHLDTFKSIKIVDNNDEIIVTIK